jgi:hypothetical protein
VGLSVFELLISGAFSRPLTIQDGATAAIIVFAFFVFMPAFLFLRGKTSLRTLTISPQGIDTEIGKMKAQRPWSQIKIVSEARDYVLIGGASGNAFFIPNRAFSMPEQKSEFVAKISTWMADGNSTR